MAYNENTTPSVKNLKELSQRINKDFAKKSELTPINNALASAFKSGAVSGNAVNFYTSADKTGTPALTFDFPAELFLDQTKTQFVAKFAWDEATYPGSTNPNLNNKPVMVLAVKGEDDSVSYSFLNMAALVDTYSAKVEGKDASTTIEIAGYEIDVKVNISAEADNVLVMKPDGLYVPKPADVDLSGKADKVEGATEGNFAALDAEGNLTDSGKKPGDFSKVEQSDTPGSIKVDGQEVAVVTFATTEEFAEMMDEVFGPADEEPTT